VNINYGIVFELDNKFSELTIQKLLTRGIELGFLYYDYIPEKNTIDSPLLDAQEATKKVLTFVKFSDPYGRNVQVKYNDTMFTLFFYEEKNSTTVMVATEFTIEWKKMFTGNREELYEFDYNRYINLFLSLCNDFTIIRIDANDQDLDQL
jgi:hypothetical protein